MQDGTEQPQPLLALVVAAALIIAIALYVVLRAGPNVVTIVGPWLSGLPKGSSPHGWIAPSVSVGALLAGGSLAAVALAAFVRGVRQDPFRWLAPVLIAFSSVVMTRLGLERSMGPMAATLFGALTALLLLGGGVLVQAQGKLVACSGGVGLTAFVGRPAGSFARAVARSREWDRHRDQLGRALEAARICELRQTAAEARAAELEQLINDHCDGVEAEAEEFANAAKPKWQKPFIAFGLVVIGASAGAVGLHAAMVSPLQAQLVTERNAATAALAQRENRADDALSVRAQLEADRTRLQAELAAERTRAAAALAEVTAAQEQLAALTAQAEPAAPAVKETKKARVTRAKRAARKPAAKAAASPAENSGLREGYSDDPIGGL
jgi:hypothetical protein